MPRNPLFYPDDFPTEKRGASTTANNFETAINLLQTNARDTALLQIHARRSAAQGIVGNQGKITKISHDIMPSYLVGNRINNSLVIGTTAYIPGNYGLQCFSYHNENFRRSSIKLEHDLHYVVTTGNSESGKIGCGVDWSGAFSSVFNKIKYYPKEFVEGAIAQLSEPRIAAIGQIGDATRGIIAGGANKFGVLQRNSSTYTHATDTIVAIANLLQIARFAPHGGLSSKFAGYILGGSDAYFGGTPLKSIEKVNYTTNIGAATTISSTIEHSHTVHAAFGNANKGYLLGGSNASPVNTKWASNVITGFTYSGEIATALSISLPNELTCSFGAGSSEAGYVFTGWVEDSFNSLSNTSVFKLRFADEQPFLIEVKLLEDAWDTGAVSDYGAGFS
ncbi:hypothetical protein FD723_39865 (plasmid) [Nostoc sp. C052]|uniref:hypothetical protein n=1 Tax=Nostoc sp. C052 TaxID=2576902 RepID=UPI0015C3BB58|nr:hypothetical protein [Nostoc sp. C052]QLE46370.1 hypothetical protein FD723_39865 [Nostoc sp. C052]